MANPDSALGLWLQTMIDLAIPAAGLLALIALAITIRERFRR